MIALLASAVVHTATAQERTDTLIKGQTIEIIQNYKPEIAPTKKPDLSPTLPKIDTSRPTFSYVIPQQTLSYTYHSVPIRPLALGRQEYVQPFQNYLKFGLGNRSSIYVDAGVGKIKSDIYEASAHFSHLSQKGPIQHQYSSRTALDAQGKYFSNGHAFGAGLSIFRNGHSFYGYDHDMYEYTKQAIRQTFTGANVEVHAENINPNKYRVSYRPMVSFGMYNDQFSAKEKSFGLDLPFVMQIDSSIQAHLGIKSRVTQLVNDSFSSGNNYFQVNAGVDFKLGKTDLALHLSPTAAKSNQFYLLPQIGVRSLLMEDHLVLLAGWKAELIQNTFQQLSSKNPFMNNLYPVRQTKADQIYGGFETHVGNHFAFGATLSWRQWKNMALFVNDYGISEDGKQFSVKYDDKVQSLGLDAFAQYQIGETFGLHARGIWNNYMSKTTVEKVWHEPMLQLNLGLNTKPIKGLRINVEADFLDGMFAQLPDGSAKKLPAIFDLSAGAEYQLIPRLSIFTQLNNMFSQQYQRWYQYPVYGFNIIGGIRFKF